MPLSVTEQLAQIVINLPLTADNERVYPGMKLWSVYYQGVFPITVEEVGVNVVNYSDVRHPGIPFGGPPITDYGRLYADHAKAAEFFRTHPWPKATPQAH